MVFRLPLALAVWMVALRATFAAEATPVPAAPVATATSDATSAQIDAWLADDGAQPDTAAATAAPPSVAQPRAIHGEASVAMGSGGYRAATVSAIAPVGETGTLGVALADERFGGRRGGEARSFALSLMLGPGGSPEPCGLRHTGAQLLSDAARSQRCGVEGQGATP